MSTGRGSAELGFMCGERPVLDLGKGADQGRLVAQSTHLLCGTWAHGARLGKQVREAVARPRGDEAGELGQGREMGEGEGAVLCCSVPLAIQKDSSSLLLSHCYGGNFIFLKCKKLS